MTITEMLVSEKIAKNLFQAGHIATGLKFWELKTDDERMTRARLYRDWRNSGIYPKHDTASCFAKAIAGEVLPVDAMFDGALLSDVRRAADHHEVMAEIEDEN